MNKSLLSILVLFALTGCGGGGEASSGAGGSAAPEATPPASEVPADQGGDAGVEPDQPVELAAECIQQPASVVSILKDATATLKFNQPINTTANVISMCSSGPTNFANKSINVVLGQGSFTQQIPGSCAGGSYLVNFKVPEHNISKSCTWTVPKLVIFQP